MMPATLSRSTRLKSSRRRPARRGSPRRHYLEFLEQRQLLSGLVPNSPSVQTYYLPVPATSVLQALQTIHSGPKGPVSTYASISVAEDGTQIYYDQWENGYAADIANPTAAEVYNSVTNPAGVQIWGDGDPSNGAAPGYPNDVLHAGDVIVLSSPSITVPRNPSQIYFDGGDKIAATKSVAIGELDYASGTSTLLAGALQVNPTSAWGVNYKVPIGQNTAGANAMFNYTGLSIMAAKDGTTVQIDTNGDGKVDKTVLLNQGQSYLVNNGVKQGATVVSTDAAKPIQVNIITGTPSQTYASRWFTLAPIDQWSSSYFTPVSTRSTNATVVFLYNPAATAIAVTQTTRGAGGTAATLTTTTINVPAKGTAKVTMPESSGAHFYAAGGQPFYAISTTDYGSFNYDWGMSLIPDNQLTTQAIVGLGFGRDPLSTVNPTENGSPVWVTPTGNGNAPVTVYVDFNGDDAGAFTDPNGFHYDEALSLKELQSAKVFDPDGNQTAMLLYTLDPGVKLATSWGEDPASASVASPGIDAGTNIVPLPEFDAGKSATLFVDANNDGVVSPGDTLLYTIVVNNISRSTLADLQLTDNLPADLSYVDNTLNYTITPHAGMASSPVAIPDAGSTPFALDETGFSVPTLVGGATFKATFEARIGGVLPTGLNDIINTGLVHSPSLRETIQVQSDTPVKYDIGGLVFKDTNRDGAVEAGEPGLAGVNVNLLQGTSIIASALTDASGHYVFIAPPLGNYTVNVVNSSVLAVLPNSAQTAGVNPSPVSLTGGGAYTDAGIDGYMTLVSAMPSRLGGSVTVDGVGLAGVSLTLTGTNASGTIAPQTVVTDANGNYSFTMLTGNYTISETQPAGLLDGPDFAGNLGGTVAPIPGDRISGIALPGDSLGTNYNFTELKPAAISGLVYADANNNGVLDGGEAPLGGVKMTLTGSNDLGAIAPITATTGTDGSYTFGTLRPGTYTVTETQPAGYLDGLDAKDGMVIPGSNTTNAIAGISLSDGGSSNVLFGDLLPASVTGFVYADANNNGLMDTGEAPISGMKMTLTGSNDLGAITPLTATTGTDGSYTFGTLRPGTYAVTETQPAGYLDGLDAKDGAVIPGSNASDAIGGIALTSGGSSNALFGDLLPASVTGCAFVDANNNGLRDSGEAPLSGVLLTLTGTSDIGPITLLTATTAANGSYSFGTLRPGTYTVTETQPAGYLDGLDAKAGTAIANSNTSDTISGIAVNSGSNASSNSFGELQAGNIAGFVYVDANNNGLMVPGEAPISGALLTLTGVNDLGAITPVTTAAAPDGSYTFGTLRPGTYTISETQPAGYLDGLDAKAGAVIANSNATDTITGIAVNSGSGLAGNNFGELLPASVSGYVYVDANNNGVMVSGEAPISGVRVTLTGTNDLGAITSITATTAADGAYTFGMLRPGTYTVTETQPAGYLDGLDAKAGVVIANSNTSDTVIGIAVNSGGNATGNSFGELLAAGISGYVYVDANNNGLKDPGEGAISGVLLTLTGTSDLGVLAPLTITTAANGSYTFGTLRPGTYTVTETQPAGYLDGLDAKAGVVIVNSNSTDAIGGLILNSGSSATGNNFGEIPTASIAGSVYVDANNNGLKDAGETPVGGVKLTLTGTNDQGTITPLTATTAADGSYSFGTLRPGTYTVTETQPAGYLDGLDDKAGALIAGSNTTDAISGLSVISNTSANNNFGELLPAGVSGLVYVDANNNGLKESGEAPISGVKLALTGTNDLGVISSLTATTAADGSYSFGNLRPGTYTVTETQAAGYLDGLDAKNGAVITNSNISDIIGGLTLSSGGGSSATFGELLPASVSGTVYHNANDNGLRDAGEAPIGGVLVTLTGSNDLGAIAPLTATTASDGSYSFGNLRPGTYAVTETQPAGYIDGLDAKNGVVMAASNTTNAIGAIALNSGGSAIANFGELRPASITGFVYVDANNNGIKDTGEAGINCVRLTLTGTNDLGATISLTTTTTCSGSYTFANLRPGTYTVTETQPSGYRDGLDAKEGVVIANSNNTDAIAGITLSSGRLSANDNFGEISSCKCSCSLTKSDTATIGF